MGVHIFLEGRGITATLSGMGDLRALTESGTALLAPQVSVVIGQDYDYEKTCGYWYGAWLFKCC